MSRLAALALAALSLTAAPPAAPVVGKRLYPPLAQGEIATRRFRIVYTARAQGAAKALSKQIEAARDDFQKTLGRDWPGVTEVRLGVGREEFEALALPGGAPPPWAGALAYPDASILLLEAASLTGPSGPSMLRHELSHIALGRIGRGWPRWFQEGMAMHLSGERSYVDNYAALFRAVHQDRLYRFDQLADSWPEQPADVEVAYAESEAFFASLVDRHGPAGLSRLLDEVASGAGFDVAFARAFGTTVHLEEQAFLGHLPARYAWLPFSLSGSLLWLSAALLTIAGFLRRRRAMARRLVEMDAEEAAEEAARRIAAAESAPDEPAPKAPPPEDPGTTVH